MKLTIKKIALTLTMSTAILLSTLTEGIACSRFLWNKNTKGVFTARSMDWAHSFDDILYINPRGMRMNGGAVENSYRWTSKYGSLVASIIPYAKQYGFNINDGATDGINEKGLSAHLLYLEQTQYAEPNRTPGVSYFRWVRYILDNFATVEEAVEGMKNVRIAPVRLGGEVLGAHLAIEDPTGDSAIFEIINGKMIVHHGKNYTTMTNDPSYDWQMTNLKQYQTFGGQRSMPGGIEGADRFVRLAYYGQFLPDTDNASEAVANMFSLIRNVAVPFGAPYAGRAGEGEYPTWWMSVSDLNNRIYYFNWAKNPNIVWVELDKIDFRRGSGKREIDPKNTSLVGEVSEFFTRAKR